MGHNAGVPSQGLSLHLVRIVLPLSVGTSMLVISSLERDPGASAEGAFLALLATTVLLALAQVPRRLGIPFSVLSLLAAMTVWALPGTADRAAALGALLAIALIVVIVDPEHSEAGQRSSATVALFLAVQMLFRSRDLLAVDLGEAAGILGWATLAAVATLALERFWSRESAALAAVASVLLGGGFSAGNALGLVCLAAGAFLFSDARSTASRIAAVAVLVAPIFLQPAAGTVLALCGLAAAGPLALQAGAPALALAVGWTVRALPAHAVVQEVVLLPFLLPAGLLDLRHRTLRVAALGLGLAAALITDDRAALATPAALWALTVPGRESSAGARRLQGLWIGALLLGSLLVAAPPWMRTDPLAAALSLLGLAPTWAAAAALVTGFAVLAIYAGARADRLSSRWPAAEILGGLALACLVLFSTPSGGHLPIDNQAVVLAGETPHWSFRPTEPTKVSAIAVDSSLANSTSASADTVAAHVRVRGPHGVNEWPLRIGRESGEWAALRSDVGAIPGFSAPEPFLSWVDVSGSFFGQRYRAIWNLPEALTVEEIEIEMAPDVPERLTLTVFRLELRP